jgi:uncharacterized protein
LSGADLLASVSYNDAIKWVLLAFAGFSATVLNTLAGGGPLITLAAMIALGMDAKTANMTSTIALFPGQIVTGWAARAHIKPIAGMTTPGWLLATILGGAIGGALIAMMPGVSFAAQVPWLVAFATLVYLWRAIQPPTLQPRSQLRPAIALPILFVLAVYGGYFGGGNSFLVLALLGSLGLGVKHAGHVKNLIVALINAAAVVILLFGGAPDLLAGSAIALGGIIGGLVGGKWLSIISEKALRILVIGIGTSLAIWLFIAS